MGGTARVLRTAFRAVVLPSFDTLSMVPAVVVLQPYGWCGPLPLWALMLVMAVAAVAQRPDVQVWLGGGDPKARLGLRCAIQVGGTTALASYAIGWGPILGAGFAVSALHHVRLGGSRAWVPAMCWGLFGIAAGQVGIALGWVPSYLPATQAHVCALAGAFLVALLVRQYGLQTAQREQADEALGRSERRFRALVQNATDMTVVSNPDGVVTYVSPGVRQMLGVPEEGLVDHRLQEFLVPEDAQRADVLVAELACAPGATVRTELRFLHADGSVRWHQIALRNMLDDPAVAGIVANHRDVTDSVLAQEQLAYEAAHDLLTGLDNRGAFLTELAGVLAEARVDGATVAVLYLDLDGFKQVNDSLGHDAGDVVLMSAAAALRQHVLGSDLIGRLGGDEFVVALPRIQDRRDAEAVAERVLRGLREPIPVLGHSVVVDASVGIAVSGPGGEEAGPVEAQELLRRADLAMYDAKRRRGARWSHYHRGLEQASRISPEEIRVAVETGQLHLLYQPVVSLETGRLAGAEALVRWDHPTRGLVPPADFVPMAEQYGLIGLVGDWVLREACRQLAYWRTRQRAAAGLWIGVNVAADQLEDARTAGTVLDVIEEHGVPAERLVVEVTESALADSPAARATLEALHAVGVRIAIDDFGTGYSSLQYLTRLPVDVLKLDRAFVNELDGTPEGSAIAEAVIRLAQTLHLSTTAEGVETQEQADELAAMGYRSAQGYLFARPLPAGRIVEMLGRPVFLPRTPQSASASQPASQSQSASASQSQV